MKTTDDIRDEEMKTTDDIRDEEIKTRMKACIVSAIGYGMGVVRKDGSTERAFKALQEGLSDLVDHLNSKDSKNV